MTGDLYLSLTVDRQTGGFKHLFDVSWTGRAPSAAVVSLTASLDSELRGHGIRVRAICSDGVDTALVTDMDQTGQGPALIHSGGRLLTTGEIAEAAVAMLGSHRVVRTVPGWRGAMIRLSAAAPRVMMRLEPVLRGQGRRRMRRSGPRR